MMRIIILGDFHGEVDVLEGVIEKERPDYVLSTGDLSVYRDSSVPHYFIHGNHEDFETLKAMDEGSVEIKNLHHMVSGKKYVLEAGTEAVSIAGLGGNYSPTFRGRERNFTEKDVKSCMHLTKVDVFLSHEAPQGVGFTKGLKEDLGVEPVRQILDKARPVYFIFGHHHVFYCTVCRGVKVQGMGYARDGYMRLDVKNGSIEETLVKERGS